MGRFGYRAASILALFAAMWLLDIQVRRPSAHWRGGAYLHFSWIVGRGWQALLVLLPSCSGSLRSHFRPLFLGHSL